MQPYGHIPTSQSNYTSQAIAHTSVAGRGPPQWSTSMTTTIPSSQSIVYSTQQQVTRGIMPPMIPSGPIMRPIFPPYGISQAHPGILPPGIYSVSTILPNGDSSQAPGVLPSLIEPPPLPTGPWNVFVGKLPPDLHDNYVRNLLEKCGADVVWKRTKDPVTGKPKGFGYCTYTHATDALRALRLLNGFSIDSKTIIIKVDGKTQVKLDQYVNAMTEDMKKADNAKDIEVKQALDKLFKERSGTMGGQQNDMSSWGKLIDNNTRVSTSMQLNTGENNEQILGSNSQLDHDNRNAFVSNENRMMNSSTNAKEGTEKADLEQGDSSHGVDVRGKMILNEVEKFRLAQEQRAAEIEKQHREALMKRLRAEEEQEKLRKEKEEEDAKRAKEAESVQVSSESAEEGKIDSADKPADVVSHKQSKEKRSHSREHDHRRSDRSRRGSRSRRHDRERSRDRDRRRRRDRSRSDSRESKRRKRRRSPGRSEERHHRRSSRTTDDKDDSKYSSSKTRVDKRDNEAQVSSITSTPIVLSGFKVQSSAPKKEKSTTTAAPVFIIEDIQEVKPTRELIPIDYTEEEKASVLLLQNHNKSVSSEKIKELINQIPSEPEALFAYPVDWNTVDKFDIIKTKIDPWVKKKLMEYLGQTDEMMTEFILTNLSKHVTPNVLSEELQLVLEDETTMFLALLWRKLIFETVRCGIEN